MALAGTTTGAHYDRITPAWNIVLGDDLHHGVFDDASEDLAAGTSRLTQMMIKAARIQPGARVLDVGCGTGGQARQLVLRHDVRVVGITTSSVGVEQARARASEAGVSYLASFEMRDGLDTGFPDEAFDVVWLLESAQYLTPHEQMMDECTRVLRPGGTLVLADVVLRAPLEFRDLRRLHSEFATLHDAFGDGRMGTASEYAALARARGLELAEQLDLSERVRPTYPRWQERATRLRHDVIEVMGEASWQRFVDACDVLDGFFAHGTMGYTLLAARKPSRTS